MMKLVKVSFCMILILLAVLQSCGCGAASASSSSGGWISITTHAVGEEIVISPSQAEGYAGDSLEWYVDYNITTVLWLATHVRIEVGVDQTSGRNPWGDFSVRQSPIIPEITIPEFPPLGGWTWNDWEPTNTSGLFPFTVKILYEIDPDVFIQMWSGNGTIHLRRFIIVPDDYLTIQEAINHANEGDTVFVRNGTYHEHVVVNKSITLQGQSRLDTILDGSGETGVVTVIADHVNIHEFTIQNAEGDFEHGGIRIVSNNNNVSHNTVVSNFMHGILLTASSNNTVAHNDILMNGQTGVCIDESMNNSIYENNIFSSLVGIFGSSSSGNTIVGNDVSSNRDMGIYLMGCIDDEVSSNVAFNNTHGIYLSTTNHIMVCSNNVSSVSYFGIFLRDSTHCTVSENIASNSTYGIQLYGESNENEISYNLFTSNDYGVDLVSFPVYSVANNTFHGNTVAKNSLGISVGGAVNSNLFFHNNFIQNIQNAEIHSPQVWDNGCEGNFWSNYNGTDLDSDGIGDTYVPWEGVDNYPLMNLYWNAADIDHDLDVDIFDLVRCANAYGSTPSSPNWNPHCDINEPYGVISIFDVVIIGINYGEEYTP